MNNVLEYLEQSAGSYPDKICAVDDHAAITYQGLMKHARYIGMLISEHSSAGKPIAVFMDKSVSALTAFMGILYAGCFYSLIDPSFPYERIRQLLGVLDTDIVITTSADKDKLMLSGYDKIIINMDEISYNDSHCYSYMPEILNTIRINATDKDPVYCNFTSGSTGVPKGVIICHRSIIDFIDTFTKTFDITDRDVLGNQAPFDFDVSVKDIYSTLAVGASLCIIPRACFMFPNAVMDMLEKHHVTTLIWAVSALCLLNRLHGLKYLVPQAINKILFSGEVMPVRQLNAWRAYYPDALFVNLYGPTEITCNCTYYIIDREFTENDKLPIGIPFENERVLLLDDTQCEIKPDSPNTIGEICVAGSCLALGYYNNEAMTASAFTYNPLCTGYRETIYRTGDLAYYGEDGLLYFAGRKDFQIKHMGHRIELEEIENVLGNISLVEHACCFFDENKSRIVAYYSGSDDKKAILDEMRTQVPEYMLPNIIKQIPELPLTKNGKTDRAYIKQLYYGQ